MKTLEQMAVHPATKRDILAQLLRENLEHVNHAALSNTPDAVIKTFIQIDVSYTAREMLTVAREIGMLPPALDKQTRQGGCLVCGGSGVVPDGELTHSEGGIPYENGPIKTIKDCPNCNF